MTKLENLTKLRLYRPRPNPFLNDGLAMYLSQLINIDLAIDLAYKSHSCDNRFFRSEPPGTRQKLEKMNCTRRPSSIFEDPDYFILFEFQRTFCSKINDQLKSLAISDYVANRTKINVWWDDLENLLDDLDDDDFNEILEIPSAKSSKLDKIKSFKQKMKSEFVEKNEARIFELVDRMVRMDADEFLRLGGIEFLLLLYEKYKHDDIYVQMIGNCLNVFSLESKNRRLFVESGWLKRVHEMRSNLNENQDKLEITKELIAHKILHNFCQSKKLNAILYPSLIFPLHPLYAELAKQSVPSKQHNHQLDIVFVHGLRGSVFKTWRQDDLVLKSNSEFVNKLNAYIDKKFRLYSHCWPAEWLPDDLGKKNVRIFGVNYESLFSLWGQDLIEEIKLKSSIKQRAVDLLEELDQVGIGEKPCVWVCHSMGGLIIKQLLLNASKLGKKGRKIFENTKAIIFLSTPHLGSSIARTVTKFKFATNPSVELFELSTQNNKLKILSLCEGKLTYLGFNLYTATVTEESANIDYGEFHLVKNKDHLNICKPESQDCFVYIKIKELLSNILNEEMSNCSTCKEMSNENFSNFFEMKERNKLTDYYIS
ncbi:hypothetical protein BpHYR1_038581 [Brachionus plicatilis]|uniref:DUF676 domain-containing protein n=1 Tax=Brachionus plicatilis TaxID=10195 RepID=A0A3M7P5Y3_BRAPC|nr:hypothetical protein BpHYR1_038581 [Brachionus plicatilis]